MNPWLETAGVVGLGGVGAWLGVACSRLPRPWWVLGYALPLGYVLLVGLGHRVRALEFEAPFSWFMAGRREYVWLAVLGTVLLVTPMSRLPKPRDRMAVGVLAAAILFLVSAWPFLSPALVHHRLRQLVTKLDRDGVCLQGTDYNCGPAAAVTALRRLGFSAEEGELAILARTSSIHGTEPDSLAWALRDRYGGEGLGVTYRAFDSVDEIPREGYTLAVVKFGFLVDHYVTVLAVGPATVTVGDPLSGVERLPRDQFLGRWRKVGIVLRRTR